MALALVCALIYTGASLCLKRAILRGATANQVNLGVNLALALIVQPLWLLDDPGAANAALWQPLLCGILFFAGQALTFTALSRGDVSVATPLLGTKIIMVTALNALAFSLPVSGRWWVAAIVGSISVALIAGGAPRHHRQGLGLTVACSLGAAFLYSLTDVLIQHWGGSFDQWVFLPVMFGLVGIFAIFFYGAGDRKAFRPPRASLLPLVAGGVLFGVQVSGFFFALVWTRDATAANVIYSSRSVWSVAAAWAAGRLLGLREVEAGPMVMIRRLLGAILLFGAILLILL